VQFYCPESVAAPGACTGTRGYISNFEIQDILATKSNFRQLKTPEGDDIVVYDNTEWVAWTPKEKYDERSSWAKGLNLGGTTDWATLLIWTPTLMLEMDQAEMIVAVLVAPTMAPARSWWPEKSTRSSHPPFDAIRHAPLSFLHGFYRLQLSSGYLLLR
jgi:hypothetical protein